MTATYDPLMTAMGKQKNSLEVWLTCAQAPFHISVLGRKLPSGVRLPCEQRGKACCFYWPVFIGQITGYHWRFHQKIISCYFLTLGRTEEKKTSECGPYCLPGVPGQVPAHPGPLSLSENKPYTSVSTFYLPASGIKMPAQRKLSQVINLPKKGLLFQLLLPGEGRGKYYRSLTQASFT